MAIARLSLGKGVQIQGVTALSSPENKEFADELIHRIASTLDKLKGDLMDQIVIDQSILPGRVNGESETSDQTIVQSGELDYAVIESILLG